MHWFPGQARMGPMSSDLVVDQALADLASTRHNRRDATDRVPRAPGLYAFYGDEQAWSDLDLSPAFDDQPLYVGKAERSLNGRDAGTHFSTARRDPRPFVAASRRC